MSKSSIAAKRSEALRAAAIDTAAVLGALPDWIETRSAARSSEILSNHFLELGPKRENAALQ